MMRQNVQHLLAFLFAVLANLAAQDMFVARLMRPLVELEAAAELRFFNRPSCKYLGQFGNVLLRVAAVHAQRVQLHDFSRVIFVQPTRTIFCLRSRTLKTPAPSPETSGPTQPQLRIPAHALPVV